MSWLAWHQRSERLASEAHLADEAGDVSRAMSLYAEAADCEERALAELAPDKRRTLGITAVSAVSLWFKSKNYTKAERLAMQLLSIVDLPAFAASELRLLIQAIWTEELKAQSGLSFFPGQVTVSIKGGEVVHGGAPLDIVVDKIQNIQSIFFRAIELAMGFQHRVRGAPSREIQESCRPWLFQAPPGSYQFSIVIQEVAQGDLFRDKVVPSHVASQVLQIVRASAEEDRVAIEKIVPDIQYQETFRKLTRNLAPTGKRFSQLEIRSSDESKPSVVLTPETRESIKKAMHPPSVRAEREAGEEITVTGVLRALHLDRDWLELAADGGALQIFGLQDTVDDIIGPMVNRKVIVRAHRSARGRLRFVDIELDE